MPALPPPLIVLTDVTKVYVTEEMETHAIEAVQLEIRAGEYVAVAGPSGCGKTTLLSIIGLLDAPTSGRYTLAGTDVTTLGAAARARVRNRDIGFVFQAFNLIGELTVFENVELPLTYRRGREQAGAAARAACVRAALDRVGMGHRERHFPAQLSGGQQQRVAVARAVVGEPRLLLADEPTGNLDSANSEAVMALLGEVHQEGTTLCMVTHDPRYARHASRTVHLFDGHVVGEEHDPGAPAAARAPHRSGFAAQ